VSKSSIEKALTKGSAKQKALLVSNHVATVSTGGKPLLSDSEFHSLVDSFKSSQEIEIYNRYRKMFDAVRIYLTNLTQWQHSYQEKLERLDKFILLRKSNADMEDLINNLLELMPDNKTRAKAVKIAEGFSNPALMRGIHTDKEGYIQILHKGKLLDEAIKKLQEAVKKEQVNFKTAIQVIKDYLKETGFNVTLYLAFVKDAENWAKSKKGKEFSMCMSIRPNEDVLNPSLLQLLEKGSLELEYKDVEIDSDIYDRYRRDYLNA
jgi:hypothetical protein